MADFTHLHVHTAFSLLDSALRLDDLVDAAAADGMTAVAMTDHGNLFGALDFYTKCKEKGIKPIIGCELYIAPGSRLLKSSFGGDDNELAPYHTSQSGMHHIVLLCQNEIGYRNLCELVSLAYLEGFYYRPRVDKELLAKFSEGLIATSACLKGEVAHQCLIGDMDRARAAAKWYQDVYKGNFYLEIQNNGLPQQMMVNQRFQELGKELGIGLIATADVHYLKREDAFNQEVLMSIQTGRNLEDVSPSAVRTDEFYFKPQAVMKEEFSHLPEAISNTMKIADSINFDFKFTDEQGRKIYHYPKFEPPGGQTPVDYMNAISLDGLYRRMRESVELGRAPWTDEETKKYIERLDRELKVINDMGFTGYFLIVQDFINHAKAHDIPVGPGRGSGAGSLVAYSLRITDLDPIEHGLLFERFLNPERISLPDFDVDFCMDKRGQIIDYVVQKYGKESVAQIITFGKLQAKGVIRDVGRTFGMLPQDVAKIAGLVPDSLNITLDEAIAQEPRLRELTDKDPKMHFLIQTCRALEGLYRHASIHAAGLVISNRNMVEHCPLYKGKNNELVIQFDMNNADKIGLIKFDFLGLKTLTFLRRAEILVQERHPDAGFTLTKIPFNDKKTFEMLGRGDTNGVFQLESSGMQDLTRKVKPDAFGDIVAISAIYRPGPLESGMVDDFIARKHGHTPVVYDFEELRPILQETYGVIVYQEQVQQVAMRLASYTAGGADLLRRAMGKKKAEEMDKQKAIFMEGGKKNNFDIVKIEKVFDLMAKFAGYGFNKSHAAAYSLITMQTAFLKAHYQVEFFAALLSIERENTDKITKYIVDAKKHGISVLQPDINESFSDFTVVDETTIRFGLGAIKGVGQIAIDTVIEARKKDGPFTDLWDLCARCNSRTVNKRVIEAFTKAGALDSFGVNRPSLFKAIDDALGQGSAQQKVHDENQNSFFDLMHEDKSFSERKVTYPDEPAWPRNVELKYEKETTGFYMTGHPLEQFESELKRFTNTSIGELEKINTAREVRVGAEVVAMREIFTKRGDRMAFATVGDGSGEIEAVIFSDVFLEGEAALKSGEPVWIRGNLEINENGKKLLLSKKSNSIILPLRYAFESESREVHIALPAKENGLDPAWFTRLGDFLGREHKKDGIPVLVHVTFADDRETVLRLPQRVSRRRETLEGLEVLLKDQGAQIEFR